jgi:hypothetical protein
MTLLATWLDTLSRKYALGPLAPDEDGVCVLRYDASLDVVVECASDDGPLLVQIPLMPIPAGVPAGFFRQLLALNHRGEATRGATLAVNELSGTVMLSSLTPLDHLDALGFEQLIGNMIDSAQALIEQIGALSLQGDQSSAAGAVGTPAQIDPAISPAGSLSTPAFWDPRQRG